MPLVAYACFAPFCAANSFLSIGTGLLKAKVTDFLVHPLPVLFGTTLLAPFFPSSLLRLTFYFGDGSNTLALCTLW